MNNDLINEFLEKDTIDSLALLIESSDSSGIQRSASVIADAFGSGFDISSSENIEKLITSFKKNLELLVQKTWVDQSDISLKEEVLFKLNKFCLSVSSDHSKFAENYKAFLQIMNEVVYLMFGAQAKSADFDEYALRIDPEFGIFWWYVKNLPSGADWSNEKSCAVQSVAMFFLANY